MLAFASLASGERVLDLACGTGVVTVNAARSVAAHGAVLGTDLSGQMIEVAKQRALEQQLSNVSFQRMDAEALDLPDASFDVVLCAQVLEHVDDPVQALRELARVTRSGGRVLLSTHGTFVYHPNPVDLWRWTGAGLERLFSENGDWASVTVSAGSGTASSLAMLNSIYLEHVLHWTPLRPLRGGVVSVLNRLARLLDRRFAALRDERPGTIAANYHVVAEKLP